MSASSLPTSIATSHGTFGFGKQCMGFLTGGLGMEWIVGGIKTEFIEGLNDYFGFFGDGGGRIVAQGPPEKIVKSKTSRTAPYLMAALRGGC